MRNPTATPESSVAPQVDIVAEQRELAKLYSEPARRYGVPVVMCVAHRLSWFLLHEVPDDKELAEMTHHFGLERDPNTDIMCQGTVTTVWHYSPAIENMYEFRKDAEKGGDGHE